MNELRQCHPSLRVFQIKQSQKGWIFIGDTPTDFAILQSETKMKQVFGPKVKVSLPKSYHSADASKSKFLVFKGASANITIKDFKELLDFNKINHAEAERMKSKTTGKNLSFIKIKSDDPKQAEALISGGIVCQKTGIIFRVEEFKTTPSILQYFKCQGFGHKAPNCTKNEKCVVCGEAHSHKNWSIMKKGSQSAQIVGDLMLTIIEAVLHIRTKLLGSTWSKDKLLMPPL